MQRLSALRPAPVFLLPSLILLAVFASACGDDDCPTTPGVSAPALEAFAYPLAVGNHWCYQVTDSLVQDGESRLYEGFDVLLVRDVALHAGRAGWRVGRYVLDETRTDGSALASHDFYLAEDGLGLYRADPQADDSSWRTLIEFGAGHFEGAGFLLAAGPQYGDEATQDVARYFGPTGESDALRIVHEFSQAGDTTEVRELRRELYVPDRGLVLSEWEYSIVDGAQSHAATGAAELADAINGSAVVGLAAESEPNDTPYLDHAQDVTMTSIVRGAVHVLDDGTSYQPDDLDCHYFTCVNENAYGDPVLQDFYRLEIVEPGQYRFDLIYDRLGATDDLDLYCLVETGDGAFRSVARADAATGAPEYIVLLHAEPGVYYLAIQAWETALDGPPVPYALSLRPQHVPIVVTKGDGPDFLASAGK